ncbi:hypothetical protein SB6411_04286 [Klebsiella spallanzanii]|uniref:Uncharacterized protein n=1 Tax=Klebsiella spallanzanii TaxID=2587528 RepID=A0A564H032_9ENTR|nr:hypothetical protein SB6419_00023 [Klebsiella spallanzanii]VUS26750.1 hypothetical protein SB6411_04286 [Klebsiella spallanzanii]VUS51665.1 hypothetical protein SB6408_04355 [Klebsiella spallanzanii]
MLTGLKFIHCLSAREPVKTRFGSPGRRSAPPPEKAKDLGQLFCF